MWLVSCLMTGGLCGVPAPSSVIGGLDGPLGCNFVLGVGLFEDDENDKKGCWRE